MARAHEGPDGRRTTEASPSAGAPRAPRSWTRAPQDLSNEWDLSACDRATFAGAAHPVIGTPRYPLLARIGHGGMGIVYFGFHPGFEIEVAVKILPRHLVDRQPELGRRFMREGRLAARLPSSDNLVRVFDVGRDPASGLHFLVMEFVSGTTAGRWAASPEVRSYGGIPEDAALDVCISAARGLSVFHEHGAIHRDVKPDNILVPARGGELVCRAAKLSDLGLARPDDRGDMTGEAVTGEGLSVLGTPGFAAPEQLQDAASAKKSADVFSLGATLYALLAGRSPFLRDGGAIETILANRRVEHAPLATVRPDVSDTTQALIDVCLRADPAQRYPDAFALLDALLLCRRAIGPDGARPREVTAEVRRIALRSEVGDSVRMDSPAVAGLVSTLLRLEGGAPGARVALRRRSDPPLTYAWALDANGRYERDHVEPGTYELTAALAGWVPFAGEVEIREGDSNVIRLAMRERDGRISVDSWPRGAQVVLDGLPVGETPLAGLAVAPGTHALSVSLPAHEPFARPVVVRGDETVDVGRVELAPHGVLDLAGFDADVSFEMDGRAVAGRVELRAGDYALTALRGGHEPQEILVRVPGGAASVPSLAPWRRHSWTLVSDVVRWDATSDADRRRVARALAQRLPGFSLRGMETFEAGGVRHEIAVLAHAPTALEFSLVPGGTFSMGSDPGETGRRSDERRHEVHVGPFLVARTAVTQASWERLAGTNPSRFRGAALPVQSVSWQEVHDWARRAGLALPTEAQWEYACRAGTTARWSAGDEADALDAHAWFAANARGGPRPAGSRLPNAFGLFDVHGNVWEWCDDVYGEYPAQRGKAATEHVDAARGDDVRAGEPGADETAVPSHRGASTYRVFRGGGWCDAPAALRSAQRGAYRADHRQFDVGFRPALAVAPDLFTAPATPAPAERGPGLAGTGMSAEEAA